MRPRREKGRSLLRDTRGLSTAEYIILMALICVVGFIAWRLFGAHTRERSAGAHGVVSGLATTSSADGEGHGAAAGGAHHAGDEEAAAPAPGAAPHGGAGDIQRGRHMAVPGSEGEFGEDEEVTRSRNRTRNFRWIAIGVLTAGVLAILLGKKRGG
jgi:hypothetical protein